MRFLNPAGLWLLALAAPVVLLHILRPRRQSVTVSSTYLWREFERPVSASSPWQKLRWSALLIAQLATVALLALAVARPARLHPAALSEHTVFIVDASGSMRATDVGPDRVAAAIARAGQLRDSLPDGGTASIVVASDHPRVALTAGADRDAFDTALRTIDAGQAGADFAEAFSLAESLDTGTTPIGYVFLSDGGISTEDERLLPPGTRYERIGAGGDNRGITRLDVESRGSGLHVRVTIHNFGDAEVTQRYRVDVDGVTTVTADTVIDAGVSVTVDADLPGGERIEAHLDGGDLLVTDDVAVAVADRRPDRRVLLVGSGSFWRQLLGSIPGISVDVVQPDPGTAVPDGSGYDIVVYDQVAVPSVPKAPFLAVAAPSGVPGITVNGVVERPVVTLVRSEDALLDGLDLSSVAIAQSQRLTVDTSVETLVAGERAPLLLRGQLGGQRFAYLSFALTDSNLPVQVAFPLLGDRLLTELSGVALTATRVEVGDPLPVDSARSATVAGPDGQRLDVAAGDPPPRATAPGFWIVSEPGRDDRLAAVNPPAAESNIAPRPALATLAATDRPGTGPAQVAQNMTRWVIVALLALLVVEAALAWRALGVGRRQWRGALGLRAAIAGLLIAALFSPVLSRASDRRATVFLLDRSASVGGSTTAAQRWLLDALAARPDDAGTAVVVFGSEARLDRVLQRSSVFDGGTVAVDAAATDISAGLRLAAAVMPTDAKRRVVLISDGRSTKGDAVEQARRMRAAGIRIDVHPVESSTGNDVAVTAVAVPRVARVGERVDVVATVHALQAGAATVILRRDRVDVDSQRVELVAGDNTVRFADDDLTAPGAVVRYQVAVVSAGDTQSRNDTAFAAIPVEGPARVLVVEGASGGAATLRAALESGGVRTEVIGPSDLPPVEQLATYASIVLVDVPANLLSGAQISDLSTVVRDLGRGLVTVGGPRSYGVGAYRESPLSDLLPVDSEILDPKRRRTVAEVLSIDTSGSMAACHCREGQGQMGGDSVEGGVDKTDISRAAAERAIASLTSNDEIGVLAWNSTSAWVLELQRKPSVEVIDAGLRRLRPDGNTFLPVALGDAAEALKQSNAELKHIILFTDGFTDERVIEQTAEQAKELYEQFGITTSVLGTGEGAAPLLEDIAISGNGRFYPGTNLADVPEIMAQEAVIAARNFINEGEFLPEITSSDPVVAPLDASPALLGYIATTAKGTATTLMRIGPDNDPLLASWQAGLGKVTSWTSDASDRWSQRWAAWDGYVDFWARLVKSTFQAGDTTGAAQATIRGTQMHISVQSAGEYPDGATAAAVVAGPDGRRLEVPLTRTAGNTFEGDTTVDGPGTYAVGASVLSGDRVVLSSSTLASDSYPAEFVPGATDGAALQRLAELSGGRPAISPAQAFDTEGLLAGQRSWPLTPLLVLLAAIGWPIAVALSRLSLRGTSLAAARAGLRARVGAARAKLPRLGDPDPENAIRPRPPLAPRPQRAEPETKRPSGTPTTEQPASLSDLLRRKRERRDAGPPQES